MSLVNNISNLATSIGNDVKLINTSISNVSSTLQREIDDLTTLQTNLQSEVNAISDAAVSQSASPKFKSISINVPTSYDFYETTIIDSNVKAGCYIGISINSNDENEIEDLDGIRIYSECLTDGSINIKMVSDFVFGGNILLKYMIGYT